MLSPERRGFGRSLPLLLGLAFLLLSVVPASLAAADDLDNAVHRVASQLECPICQGETVADSPSGLAQDMRGVIRTRLQAGESDQQILQEFVASYGDSILTNPPKHGPALGVWMGPVLGLAAGMAILAAVGLQWRRVRRAPARPVRLVESDPAVMDELRRVREALGS